MSGNHLILDEYGQVVNCSESARWIRNELEHGSSIAIALALGNMTLLHISFVPLWVAIPEGVIYNDGGGRGVQINVDRCGSHALQLEIDNPLVPSYIAEKWKLCEGDALAISKFLEIVMGRENH